MSACSLAGNTLGRSSWCNGQHSSAGSRAPTDPMKLRVQCWSTDSCDIHQRARHCSDLSKREREGAEMSISMGGSSLESTAETADASSPKKLAISLEGRCLSQADQIVRGSDDAPRKTLAQASWSAHGTASEPSVRSIDRLCERMLSGIGSYQTCCTMRVLKAVV